MSEEIDLFASLDAYDDVEYEILKPPFPYPGGKSRSVKQIIEQLPDSKIYVEPFGGSGAVLLAKKPVKLEVLNDRYAGVVAFYRCIRDEKKLDKLCDLLHLTIHSKEDFLWCKDTWNQDWLDDVERAARWFYMISYSFASLGRNWGRALQSIGKLSGKVRNKIPEFPALHDRLKKVQIDNQDWSKCFKDYDSPDTVFYIDPPYIEADSGIYKNKMTHDDHRRLINTIRNLDGFCAVSGYSNPIYDDGIWDAKITWKSFVSMKSIAYTKGNQKENLKGLETRGHAEECLWIKEW